LRLKERVIPAKTPAVALALQLLDEIEALQRRTETLSDSISAF
jgi:hypothetical protein